MLVGDAAVYPGIVIACSVTDEPIVWPVTVFSSASDVVEPCSKYRTVYSMFVFADHTAYRFIVDLTFHVKPSPRPLEVPDPSAFVFHPVRV